MFYYSIRLFAPFVKRKAIKNGVGSVIFPRHKARGTARATLESVPRAPRGFNASFLQPFISLSAALVALLTRIRVLITLKKPPPAKYFRFASLYSSSVKS